MKLTTESPSQSIKLWSRINNTHTSYILIILSSFEMQSYTNYCMRCDNNWIYLCWFIVSKLEVMGEKGFPKWNAVQLRRFNVHWFDRFCNRAYNIDVLNIRECIYLRISVVQSDAVEQFVFLNRRRRGAFKYVIIEIEFPILDILSKLLFINLH